MSIGVADENSVMYWLTVDIQKDVRQKIQEFTGLLKSAGEAQTTATIHSGSQRVTVEKDVTEQLISQSERYTKTRMSHIDQLIDHMGTLSATYKSLEFLQATDAKVGLPASPKVEEDKRKLKDSMGDMQGALEEAMGEKRAQDAERMEHNYAKITTSVGHLGRALMLLGLATNKEKDASLSMLESWESAFQMTKGLQHGVEGVTGALKTMRSAKDTQESVSDAIGSSSNFGNIMGGKSSAPGGLASGASGLAAAFPPATIAVLAATAVFGVLMYAVKKHAEAQERAEKEVQDTIKSHQDMSASNAKYFQSSGNNRDENHRLDKMGIGLKPGFVNDSGESESFDLNRRSQSDLDRFRQRSDLQDEQAQNHEGMLGANRRLSQIQKKATPEAMKADGGFVVMEALRNAEAEVKKLKEEEFELAKKQNELGIQTAKAKLDYEQQGLQAAKAYAQEVHGLVSGFQKSQASLEVKLGEMAPGKQQQTLSDIQKLQSGKGDDLSHEAIQNLRGLGDEQVNAHLDTLAQVKARKNGGKALTDVQKKFQQQKFGNMNPADVENDAREGEGDARKKVQEAQEKYQDLQSKGNENLKGFIDALKKATDSLTKLDQRIEGSREVDAGRHAAKIPMAPHMTQTVAGIGTKTVLPLYLMQKAMEGMGYGKQAQKRIDSKGSG